MKDLVLVRPPILFSALVAVSMWAPAVAADAARGKLLYQNTCNGCHESVLHLRERREAKSFGQVKAQVVRWSIAAQAQWNAEDVEDVADYLNAAYYRYPCAPEQCSFSAGSQ